MALQKPSTVGASQGIGETSIRLPKSVTSCRQKRKSPDWRRGAFFYAKKYTTLMFALSSKKCVTSKLLKGRTLARLRQADLALIKGDAVVAGNRNELKR